MTTGCDGRGISGEEGCCRGVAARARGPMHDERRGELRGAQQVRMHACIIDALNTSTSPVRCVVHDRQGLASDQRYR